MNKLNAIRELCAPILLAGAPSTFAGCGSKDSSVQEQYERKFGGKEELMKELEKIQSGNIPILRFIFEPGFRGKIEDSRDRANGIDTKAHVEGVSH